MIGDFNGGSLVVDPVSGFLIKSNHVVELPRRKDGTFDKGYMSQSTPVFGAFEKQKFLNLASEMWPNITAICDQVGISRDTYKNHYEVDEKFKRECDLIRDRVIDKIENVRMAVASTPAGSFDRMCTLNAYRREIYNPKVQIEVQHTVTPQEGRRRLDALSHVVDAEIVDTVQKLRRERAHPSRPQNPKSEVD